MLATLAISVKGAPAAVVWLTFLQISWNIILSQGIHLVKLITSFVQ